MADQSEPAQLSTTPRLKDTGKPYLFQALNTLGRNRGGLTKAVYERFSFLAAQFPGQQPVLLLNGYQSDADEVFQELLANGSLPPNTIMRRMHDDLSNVSVRTKIKPASRLNPLAKLPRGIDYSEIITAQGNTRRFFENGAFVALAQYRADGSLAKYEEHQENQPHIPAFRDHYTKENVLQLREFLSADFKVRYRQFFTPNGFCYLSCWVSPSGSAYRATLHSGSGLATTYESFKDLEAAWLQRVAESSKGTLYQDEPMTTYALHSTNKAIKRVALIHTTHYNNNEDLANGLKSWVKFYASYKENVSRFCLFTQLQVDEWETDLKLPVAQTVCIPHAAPELSPRAQRPHDTSAHSAVMVARLDPSKRIDDAIRAVGILRDKGVNINFDVWGIGPDEARLKKLIKELRLSNSVKLRGYTDNALEKFRNSNFSILTSAFEGFGLVLTESFSQGTPVVTYDVKYGPRAVVKDGINGLTVPNGDIDALALAIEKLASDAELLGTLVTGAEVTAREMSPEAWRESWKSFHEELQG